MEVSIVESPTATNREEARNRNEPELPAIAPVGRISQVLLFNNRYVHKHRRCLWLSVALFVLVFYYFGGRTYQLLSGVVVDDFLLKGRDEAHITSRRIAPHRQEMLERVYHSADVFRHDFKEMEKKFKVYVYPDGNPETYYQTPRKLTGKYSSEGYFFQNLRESRFVTNDSAAADLFFLPISCHKMRGKVRSPFYQWGLFLILFLSIATRSQPSH